MTFVGGSTSLGKPSLQVPVVLHELHLDCLCPSVRYPRRSWATYSWGTSPHPGTIMAFEDAPGGARTEDPAIAYDTVSYEPILNVYQPLITYNGSTVGPSWQAFVPSLATCVPGSPQCQALYGGPHSTTTPQPSPS